MANPVRQAITTTGNETPIMLDFYQSPFNVSIEVDVSQAVGATYGVQYTLDDILGIFGTAVASPLWLPDANLPAGQTASGVSNYQFPILFAQVVVTALTSGTIYFKIVQGISTPA